MIKLYIECEVSRDIIYWVIFFTSADIKDMRSLYTAV